MRYGMPYALKTLFLVLSTQIPYPNAYASLNESCGCVTRNYNLFADSFACVCTLNRREHQFKIYILMFPICTHDTHDTYTHTHTRYWYRLSEERINLLAGTPAHTKAIYLLPACTVPISLSLFLSLINFAHCSAVSCAKNIQMRIICNNNNNNTNEADSFT